MWVHARYNCAPLVADLFLYSYEADFVQHLHKSKFKAQQKASFNLLTKYLDLCLEFDEDAKLFTQLYDKREDFDFPRVNFPYLSSNIPESPAYGVFVSQLVLGFVRNMKIFCSEDLFWFQSYWCRDILHGNFRLLFGNSMIVIQTLFTNLTLMCHICWRFVHQLWHMTGFHMCGRNLNGRSFRNTWFHSLWGVHDFTHSLYMYYIICHNIYGLMTLVCLPGLVWLLCLGLICLSHLTGLEYSFSKVARIFLLKEHR